MSPTAHRVLLPLLAPRERPVTAHHYGMWVVNLPPRQCTQYSSITASHHEREEGLYASKSQILPQNLFILHPVPILSLSGMIPGCSSNASEGTAPLQPQHTRTTQSCTYIPPFAQV